MTKKTAKTIKSALKELLLPETANSQETLCIILQSQGFGGDDTIFVAPISVKKVPEITKKIMTLLSLAS